MEEGLTSTNTITEIICEYVSGTDFHKKMTCACCAMMYSSIGRALPGTLAVTFYPGYYSMPSKSHPDFTCRNVLRSVHIIMKY